MMKMSKSLLFFVLISSVILVGGCSLPQEARAGEIAETSIATTAAAVFTQAAETVASTLPTATIFSTAITAPEATATTTLIPTVPVATTTNTPVPCNRASFVKDVTYADGSEVAAGTTFTKIWRIKNNGSCTWTSDYALLFESGDQMGAPATASMTSGTVTPGSTVDISVALTAPANSGTYQGRFKLRSADNIVFGINTNGQEPFWVKIVVQNLPTTTTSDMVDSSGTVNINASSQADLDTGAADVAFHLVSALDPQNGAKLVLWGNSAPTKSECSGAALSTTSIPVNNYSVDHFFCYKTDQGRLGNFKVAAFSSAAITIDYVTWTIP